jgi:hypothetical protein
MKDAFSLIGIQVRLDGRGGMFWFLPVGHYHTDRVL